MRKIVKTRQYGLLAVFFAACYLFILVLEIHKSDIWSHPIAVIQDTLGYAAHPQRSTKPPLSQRKKDLVRSLPWYINGGGKRPVAANRTRSGRRLALLWPEEKPGSDRIVDQLMFIPPVDTNKSENSTQALKKIYIHNHDHIWEKWELGQKSFIVDKCPVDTCALVGKESAASETDAVLFNDKFPARLNLWSRPAHQVWILHFLESPYHTKPITCNDQFNWTATYRSDSDVADVYARWEYYDENVKRQPHGSPAAAINWAANKTKQVAWFVSNCKDRNGRQKYAEELSKYISVDIYGQCGSKTCSRSDANSCFEILKKDYKFYLAFENSNCEEYITEKLFVNALGNNVIPIVMGARPVDYERSAPFMSYIHVDEFETPRDLAAYLHKLDKDDKLYNEYFQWKGTGEMIETHFLCRLCAMLHDPDMPRKNYEDVAKWWNGPETCVDTSWREHRANKKTL